MRILYGGVAEEIMDRWGVIALVCWTPLNGTSATYPGLHEDKQSVRSCECSRHTKHLECAAAFVKISVPKLFGSGAALVRIGAV